MKPKHVLFLALVSLAAASSPAAQSIPLPNGTFEAGQDTPAGWSLSGGNGAWIENPEGGRAIAVTGTGKTGDTNFWRSGLLPLQPSTIYRLRFRARRIEGTGGCPITGPSFCNRDISDLGPEWGAYTSYFITPAKIDPGAAYLRFGQWEVAGTVAYDDVELSVTEAAYREKAGITLGEGESISNQEYVFTAPLGGVSLNQARPLMRFDCSYNAPRWAFGTDNEVVYAHTVGSLDQRSGSVEINIGYYTSGALVAEAGTDGVSWKELGTISSVNTKIFDIPQELFPAKTIWVRMRGCPYKNASGQLEQASLQVHGYTYRSALNGSPAAMQGKTTFLTTAQDDPKIKVQILSLGDALPGGDNVCSGLVDTDEPLSATEPNITLISSTRPERIFKGVCAPVSGASAAASPAHRYELKIPYEVPGTGDFQIALSLGDLSPWRAEAEIAVPHFYESAYGALLPASNETAGLWWASSGWKINQIRPLPEARDTAVRIQAAQNETEAAQFVIRPNIPLKGLQIACGALHSPGGKVIAADCVETLRVRYISIQQPTDSTGVAAPWPDPLPPFAGKIDLEPGLNQPVWVRVHVPKEAVPGTYTGAIELTADGYTAQIPLEVTVFGFALPDRMTCTTAFGFNPPRAFRYHRANTPEEQRAVYEMYLATLGAHHIGPYNPAALDPFVVTWPDTDPWKGGYRDRSEKHGGESALRLMDNSPTEGAKAGCEAKFDIPEKGIRLSFWYKTAAAPHTFLVTLNHCDANGEWMAGRNNDIPVEGDGTWQQFQQTISAFPAGAKSFKITLWPALYADNGSTQGEVWFDDLKAEDAGSGKLIVAGDFEPPSPESLTPRFDWAAWDAAMIRAFDEYHFNGFAVPIPGMGGGTFHERYEPELLGYGENTPEYKTAFRGYCQGVQAHLRERGWAKDSYVYWFDEPDPKDYEFVMNGFRKLKENGPDIGRMLTEQVEPELVGGPNIWCPLTPAFDAKLAEQRRAEGDRFWWYICCGPKAPYVTLFTDHPGTELRVWLWQTWKRRIDGILIWETNYWTSETAYPDSANPQNPYADTMSWTTGYGIPTGTKIPWGNGDGRFIYPPEAAADGNPPSCVFDKPVDSIRFEMLRDGVEDYEYLAMLERLLKKHGASLTETQRAQYAALIEVPEDISADLTHFTKDPAPIESRRAAVARAIETFVQREALEGTAK